MLATSNPPATWTVAEISSKYRLPKEAVTLSQAHAKTHCQNKIQSSQRRLGNGKKMSTAKKMVVNVDSEATMIAPTC
jgi:hypothetical protein